MMPSTTEAVRAGACRIGYSKLTPQQEEATVAFVNGNDVFISLPTGSHSGKTVCFAVLPFAFDILLGEQGCIAIVVSPLIIRTCDLDCPQQLFVSDPHA